MRKLLGILLLQCIFFLVNGQVYTNTYSTPHVTARGMFGKSERITEIFLPLQDTAELLRQERQRDQRNRPYKFATSILLDISLLTHGRWERVENGLMIWRIKLISKNALSTSINFDRFHLSDDAELFIYNGTGTMITGPVTSKENNESDFWGSGIYKGESLIIELKVPEVSMRQCDLHIINLAHGFKSIFRSAALGYGASDACEIDVLCPLGVGWEKERRSVALVINENSTEHCSGSLLMNTCNNNIPYFLTANHCYSRPDGSTRNVAQWKFIFQYWSPPYDCGNSFGDDGLRSLSFNGSALKANYQPSDFALLQLNDIPPSDPDPDKRIHYAGWDRNISPATNTTLLHHPLGDVMKISRDSQPAVSNPGPIAFLTTIGGVTYTSMYAANTQWKIIYDLGTAEPGSSGAPLFNQDKRIVGQHHGTIGNGGINACDGDPRYAGRFDVSWTGGGTDATRLSNWLDPSNTGVLTTNTTPVSSLRNPDPINGAGPIVSCLPNLSYCNGSATTPINFTSNVTGATFTWTMDKDIGKGVGPTPGNIPSFTITNNTNTNTPRIATVTVTAMANGITGPPTTFTITANPKPVVYTEVSGGVQYFCSGMPSLFPPFQSTVSGTEFSWTSNVNLGFGISGNGYVPPFTAINVTDNVPVFAGVTHVGTANGCVSAPYITDARILRSPTLTPFSNYTYNHGDQGSAITFTSSGLLQGQSLTFNWGTTTNVGFGFIGTGNINAFPATNTTNAPKIATVNVTAKVSDGLLHSCTSAPIPFTVSVNPILSSSLQSKTNCACHGGNTGQINVTASGGTPSYSYTIAGPTVNTTGVSSGQFTNLTAGTYSVTSRDAGSHTSTVSNISITEPAGTAPDAILSVADYTDNFFPANASQVTLIYQMGEIGGNPALNNILRITKQAGYAFSLPAISAITVGGNNYSIDNSRWTVDNSNPIFYNVSLNSGQQLGCGQFINLAVRLTRTSPNKLDFTLTSLVQNVMGEVQIANNATTIILVGQ